MAFVSEWRSVPAALLLLSLLSSSFISISNCIEPFRLRVEYIENPIGIDVLQPRFFWAVNAENVRGATQGNYQVVVYDRHSGAKLADSGKVTSSTSVGITVSGDFEITSNTDYRWTVQLWDDSSANAPSSIQSSEFSSGLLAAGDWAGAQWIGLPKGDEGNQLRTTFVIPSAFMHARCYVASPGYYTAGVNDEALSQNALGYFTTFEMRMYYDTFDCGHLLRVGSNAFGITLGHGWYSQSSVHVGPRMAKVLVRVVLQDSDSTVMNVVSNSAQWTQFPGPITFDDIYIGENYNALMETPGWLTPAYNDSRWAAAAVVSNPTIGVLSSAAIMPVSKRTNSYTPVSITEPGANTYVVDFGQNVAGWCRITIPGNDMRGKVVTLIHSEELDTSGFIVQMYGNSPMIANYTLRGDGEPEVYEPSFTYFGYQYVQVTGYPGALSQNSLVSYFIHSDFNTLSSIVFGPSNVNAASTNASLLNALQHMTRFASLSNYISIPTDCPQRERRGWLGDAQLSAHTTMFNFDMAATYTKFLRDIRDSQLFLDHGGALGDTVPFYHHGQLPGDPSWTAAYVFLVYWMYVYYSDVRVAAQHYEGMRAQLTFVETQLQASTGLLPVSASYYGDWCAVVPTGVGGCSHKSALLNTFDWGKQCLYFSRLAAVLGNATDAHAYAAKYQSAQQAIYAHFWDASLQRFNDPLNQIPIATINSLALDFHVLNESNAAQIQACVVNGLVRQMTDAQHNHNPQGIVGVKYIFSELCKAGYCAVALRANTQRTYPSYGYWLENQATTLWENWGSSQYHADGSKNHIMFGAQSAWYYQHLAGIRYDERDSGLTTNWDHVFINPFTNATDFGIDFISASLDTYRGQINFAWTVFNGGLCGTGGESETVSLACASGGTIDAIVFASYGLPTGSCGSYAVDPACNNNNSYAIVSKLCLSESSCAIPVSNAAFGYDPCVDIKKHFDVEVHCTKPLWMQYDVEIPSGAVANIYFNRLSATATENKFVPQNEWVVSESGAVIWKNMVFDNSAVKGVLSGVATNANQLMFQIQSGQYSFQMGG